MDDADGVRLAPRPLPPIALDDVDPRAYGCSDGPYRLLVVAHAPRRLRGADLIVCGHCRIPWEELRTRIHHALLMERAAPRPPARLT